VEIGRAMAAKLVGTKYGPPAPAVVKRRRWPTPGDLAKALDRTTVQTPALELIDKELVELAEGEHDRLMIFMPPQEGKSERASHRFPEWLLTHDHNLRVAIVSYADEMARRWGADIKLDAETFDGDESTVDLGLSLRADSRAAGRWQIDGGKGGVYCVGIGGSLTGKAVDWLIIDDPLKDLEQAQSARYRERAKRFWQGVCIPRLGPGSKCVLIQTRWHEDDLAGWLLRNEPGRWKIVVIPAVSEALDDLLNRPIGEPMISARGKRNWKTIRHDVGEYVWAALYQQRPAPAAGGLFKRKSFRYWQWLPSDPFRHDAMGGMRIALGDKIVYLSECWRFLTVDLAASTKTSADFTVAGVWLITLDGDLVLIDGDSARLEETEHWSLVRPLRERWSADAVFVESAMIGTTLVRDATEQGVPVAELKAETDKITRAIPASTRLDTGRLWLPAADTGTLTVRDVVDQCVQFPNAVHDDWVDVISYAARVVIAHWTGRQVSQPVTPYRVTDTDRAFQSQTGVDPALPPPTFKELEGRTWL
jgi:predicted phage terminase large subunit-like protein